MRFRPAARALAVLCALLPLAASAALRGATAADRAIPPFAHVIVIVEENKSYARIIGNDDAPRLTALAGRYGNATEMYGEVHPSEGNYVAMIGGSTFGIHDDDAWYCTPHTPRTFCHDVDEPSYAPHAIDASSLPDQLTARKLTWRGYFADLPAPGSLAIVNAADATRAEGLYAAKHNPFLNFNRLRTVPDFAAHELDMTAFDRDLAAGALPAFAFVVPNQCDEMHGLSPSAANVPADCTGAAVIRRGDAYAANLVERIIASSTWQAKENVAIVITFDEDDHSTVGPQGCCGYEPASRANFGGGHIPTIVITNHGPRGVVDATPHNHYSLLRTLEDAFGVDGYLAGASAPGVVPMTKLFAR